MTHPHPATQPPQLQLLSLRSTALNLDSDRVLTSRQAAVRRARASSDPGNTLATATPWGAISGKRTVRDTVSRQDVDIYKLVFDDLTDIKLTFNNRSQATLAGSLLNSQGQPLSSKKNRQFGTVGGKQTFQHTFEQLATGTYFLRVQSKGSGNNVYKLTLALSPSFPPFPPCGC